MFELTWPPETFILAPDEVIWMIIYDLKSVELVTASAY